MSQACLTASESLLAHLYSLHPRKIDLSLHRCARLLRALGSPQKRLATTIHIAGTNGKGSTLACLERCLQAMGFRTQAYLSPHICRFNERIRLGAHKIDGATIDGAAIDDALLYEYLTRVEEANAGCEITFFEITTAAAFLAFAEHPADFLILETGLGGRLDATNLVERKCAAVLTPIDYDHAQFLGNNLDVITGEKVAIAKGADLMLSAQQQREEIIIEYARSLSIPLYLAGRDFSLEKNSAPDEMTLCLHNSLTQEAGAQEQSQEQSQERSQEPEKILLPAPSAIGEHQRDNAALAASTLLALFRAARLPCSRERLLAGLREGIASFSQPARLQRLSPENVSASFAPSLKALLKPESATNEAKWEVLLDGAHNPHAARALVKALEQHWQGQAYCLILCLMEGKDARAFSKVFTQSFAQKSTKDSTKDSAQDSTHRIARGFAYGGGESAEGRFFSSLDLAACAKEANLHLQPVASLAAACRALSEEEGLPPRLLIAGSLYLAAEILATAS